MIVVAQGSAGAGKTTQLQLISHLLPQSIYIPEICLPLPPNPDDAFFVSNDIAKYDTVAHSEANLYLMDRDFLSTLAYIRARDGRLSSSAKQYTDLFDQLLDDGDISLPDIFLHFTFDFSHSRLRQRQTNPKEWFDKMFVRRYDHELQGLIEDYIVANQIRYVIIDATLPKEKITNQIVSIIKEDRHAPTRTS